MHALQCIAYTWLFSAFVSLAVLYQMLRQLSSLRLMLWRSYCTVFGDVRPIACTYTCAALVAPRFHSSMLQLALTVRLNIEVGLSASRPSELHNRRSAHSCGKRVFSKRSSHNVYSTLILGLHSRHYQHSRLACLHLEPISSLPKHQTISSHTLIAQLSSNHLYSNLKSLFFL